MFNRLNRALQQALDPNKLPPQQRQPTVEDLLPGDVVSLWDGGDHVVEAVLECREDVNRRETAWRWNLLDEGHVLEVSPEGNSLYERTVILHQDSAEFETLTCDPGQGAQGVRVASATGQCGSQSDALRIRRARVSGRLDRHLRRPSTGPGGLSQCGRVARHQSHQPGRQRLLRARANRRDARRRYR